MRATSGNGHWAKGEADKALVAVLAAAVVLLLLISNVQLWRLADRSPEGQAQVAAAGTSLPPPTSGTSNEVLSRQMRRLTSRMTAPLNGLSTQFAGLQGLGGAQRDVAKQIAAMSASLRGFGAVRGELGQVSNGLGTMLASTSAMTKGLNTMGRNMRATRDGIAGMAKVMRQVQGGIAATGASSREMTESMVAMRSATTAMAESTEASSREMTTAISTMNQNMRALLQLFCLAFNSNTPQCAEPEAPTAETPSAEAPPALEQATSGSSSLGQPLLQEELAPALSLGPAGGTRPGR